MDRRSRIVSTLDPRCSGTVLLPPGATPEAPPTALWVFVHGTDRQCDSCLDAFAEPAAGHRAAVLAPYFPADLDGPTDVDGYKFVENGDTRFDAVLLDLVEGVRERCGADVSRFFLHGFSGGGQFAHRFLYLHPDRLSAASVGAPGRVTLPDPELAWWHGVADLADRFGAGLDADAVARVPVQVVVGDQDRDAADVAALTPGPGGDNRLARARSLAEALRRLGADVAFDVVPGVGHDAAGLLPAVREFLEAQVSGRS